MFNSDGKYIMNIDLISNELKLNGFYLVLVNTIHTTEGNKKMYQVTDGKMNNFPKSRNNKQCVGEETILNAYKSFNGLYGVLKLFGII